MIDERNLGSVIGSTAVDRDGDKLGKVNQIFLDDETGRPEWATIHTGLFGTKETFVPLSSADFADNQLRVGFEKTQVKDAPHIDADSGHLSPQEEDELYRYYGLSTAGTEQTVTTGRTTGTDGIRDGARDEVTTGTVGHDTSGPNTDTAMTRSEEQLRVGTRTEEVGRARLRKFVVTENVTQTVPVSHEEVRVEREPITDANVGNALDGPAISEEEHEVTLHAERPVVQKETVPVERVRLDTQTVTDQETVTEGVRKEQIEFEGVDGDRATR